ncbi:MAG: hypothetical protein H6838_02465 [Planctomycetes bacterium]|nr:hypothetical protein [Planctomycetota bacterium]
MAAAVLSGCGAPSTLHLPTTRSVGPLPPATDTVTVSVHPDGRLVHDGKTIGLDALGSLLSSEASTRTKTHIFGLYPASDLNLLLEVDRDLPVGALLPLQLLLERPDIRVHRVFFAARAESQGADGDLGAIAWFQPPDIGGSDALALSQEDIVTMEAGKAAPHPADLYHQLHARQSSGHQQVSALLVNPPANAPFGLVLQVAEAGFQAGTRFVYLGGDASASRYARMAGGSKGLDDVVAAIPPLAGELEIRLAGKAIPHVDALVPTVPSVRDGFVGLHEIPPVVGVLESPK